MIPQFEVNFLCLSFLLTDFLVVGHNCIYVFAP